MFRRTFSYFFASMIPFFVPYLCYAQLSGSSSGSSKSPFSSSIPSSQPSTLKPLPKPQQIPAPSPLPPPPKPVPVSVAQTSNYFHPGILVVRDGEWQGGDHLLNLSSHIRVVATLVKPENVMIDLTEEQIRQQVQSVFSRANMNFSEVTLMGQPPLPAFQVQILLYPIERGYVACCEGRLFESVILQRFNLHPGTFFQAITWEKKNLIIAPTAMVSQQLQKTIDEIAQAFLERFEFYEQRKKEMLY